MVCIIWKIGETQIILLYVLHGRLLNHHTYNYLQKLFDVKMSEFKIRLLSVWTQGGQYEELLSI